MTPTPAGEGKTTTTVGLGDALNQIGEFADTPVGGHAQKHHDAILRYRRVLKNVTTVAQQ